MNVNNGNMAFSILLALRGLPRRLSGKESTCQCRRCRRPRFNRWVKKIPWKRKSQPIPGFLPEKFRRHDFKTFLQGSSLAVMNDMGRTDRVNMASVLGKKEGKPENTCLNESVFDK